MTGAVVLGLPGAAQAGVVAEIGELEAAEQPGEEEPEAVEPPVAEPETGEPAEVPVSAEIGDGGEPDAEASRELVAAIETQAEPVLRTEPQGTAGHGRDERLRSAAPRKRAEPLPGYCNFRRHPGRCYLAATNRARDQLCSGDPTCEQAFDASPCIADRASQACADYIQSRPCLDDPSSFECALFNSARSSYCAVETDQFYCGGSGSTGPETFGPPGAPQMQLVGVFDRAVGGRLVLADRTPKRPPRPLPMSGYEPVPPLLVALVALLAGAGLRRTVSRLT